jgi:hypothetical protein
MRPRFEQAFPIAVAETLAPNAERGHRAHLVDRGLADEVVLAKHLGRRSGNVARVALPGLTHEPEELLDVLEGPSATAWSRRRLGAVRRRAESPRRPDRVAHPGPNRSSSSIRSAVARPHISCHSVPRPSRPPLACRRPVLPRGAYLAWCTWIQLPQVSSNTATVTGPACVGGVRNTTPRLRRAWNSASISADSNDVAGMPSR